MNISDKIYALIADFELQERRVARMNYVSSMFHITNLAPVIQQDFTPVIESYIVKDKTFEYEHL